MLLARDADLNVSPANTVPKTVRYWGEFIYDVVPAESITEIYDIIDPATDKLTVNSSGYIGIGANPQSALDVSGAIRVSGGITPTYSSPSFSAGQIGYTYQGSFNYSTSYASGSYTAMSTITFLSTDIGVWIINATMTTSQAQNAGFGYIQVRATSGTFTIPNSTCSVSSTMNVASQQWTYNPISVVTLVQGASVLSFAWYPVTTSTIGSAYFTATRIA